MEEAASKLQRETGCGDAVRTATVDLGDFSTIAAFLTDLKSGRICGDVASVSSVICNAGAILADSVRVNHLGHFALVLGVLDLLAADGGGTVVNVASCAHWTVSDGARFSRPFHFFRVRECGELSHPITSVGPLLHKS
jgi:NAD(P)-dependent dehydrogenase (short-subunit alcohol dehydrogenase family)